MSVKINNTAQSLFLILVIWMSLINRGYTQHSHSLGFCGVLPPHTATSSNPDSIVYDRFGNSYDLYEYTALPLQAEVCNSGYFQLSFSGLSGEEVPPELQPTICKVFEDLSAIIQRRTNINSCGEIITPSSVKIVVKATQTGVVLGAASPRYQSKYSPCEYVETNLAYEAINGGNGIFNAGILDINPAPLYPWHTDWTTPPTGDKYDLYSVVLHEALHILGFASLIGMDGNAEGSFFSLWDQMLYAGTYDPNGTTGIAGSVLTSDCMSNCWELNSMIFNSNNEFDDNVINNCSTGGYDLVFGKPAIAPIAGGFGNTPSSTGQFLNMLSHLNVTCNGQSIDYLMQPSLDINMERTITQSERAILCKLGYLMNDCDECFLVTNPENYLTSYLQTCCGKDFYGCENETITIDFSTLLCNDLTNGAPLTITDAYIDPNLADILDIEIVGNSIEITPSQQGSFTVFYTVSGCDCRMSNSSFQLTIGPCIDCSGTDPCVDLSCSNGFEDFAVGSHISVLYELGGYWIHKFTASNTPDICGESNGNKFLKMLNHISNKEGFALHLKEPVEPGCTAVISFKGSAGNSAVSLEIYGSEFAPCHPTSANVNLGCIPTDCGTYTYEPMCIENVPITNIAAHSGADCPASPNFITYTITWPNLSDKSVNYIIMTPGIQGVWTFLDDITVTKSCANACFEADIDCATVSLIPCYPNLPVSHLWDFGDNNTSTDISPTHTYSGGGDYTITHTVIDECGNTHEEETIITACSNPTFTYEVDGCSNSIHFSSNEPGAHYWVLFDQNGDIVDESTSPNPTFNFNEPLPATYTVHHSIDGGTESVQTFTFIGSDINSITNASDLSTNTGLADQFVSFNGKLVINVPIFEMNNITGRMGAGANIVVNGGKTLNVYGSFFISCDRMWKGFEAYSGSTLRIHGSTVNDAQYAIKASGLKSSSPSSSTLISIKADDFDRNFIGVYVPRGGNGEKQNVTFSEFYDNDFKCTASLKPKYAGQASDSYLPQPGDWAYSGVWVAELAAEMAIGVGGTNPNYTNTFDDLRNGVCSERSNLVVKNSTFQNMKFDQAYGGFTTGAGIFLDSHGGGAGQLTQTGLGNGGPATFSNCKWGILSKSTKVNIIENQMEKVVYGISVEGVKLGNISITDNGIKAYVAGIQLLHNGFPAVALSVTNNKISINTQPGVIISPNKWGIRVEDDKIAYASSNIINNAVSVNSLNTLGIGIQATKNLNVINNPIALNINGKATGISVAGSEGGTLQDNTVTGLDTGSPTAGIFVDNSPNLKYCCNTVDKTKNGIAIQGMSVSEDKFQANHFNQHETGLLLTPDATVVNSTVLGSQTHMGNRWHEDTQQIPFGALHNGSQQSAFNSIFAVNPTTPDYVPNVANPTGWFLPNNGTNPDCPVVPICGACNFDCFDGNPSEFEKKIAQNSPDIQDINSVVRWQGERSLYRTLTEDIGQINSIAYLQDFYNQTSNSATGDFLKVENGIKDLLTIGSSEQSTLDNFDLGVQGYQSQLDVMREELVNASPAQAEIVEAEIVALTDDLSDVIKGKDQLLNSIEANLVANTVSVKFSNSAINTNTEYQSNERIVNQILLNAIENGGLDFAYSQQTLEAIANQCPYKGGDAVFRARSMMALIDNTASYDDEVICQPSFGERDMSPEAPKTNSTASFYPNPTNNWLTVEYNFPDAEDLTFTIYNTNGMEMEQVKLPMGNGSQQVSTKKLANGIYYCKIMENGKTRIIEKIAILR